MSVSPLAYHWTRAEFVRAWEAGVFDHRVELIDGEVWPVVIGSWHGVAVMQAGALLRRPDVRVTAETLPTGDSLPDPDCWVRRADARPVGTLGSRLNVWDAADVLLVVEVSDDTVLADLNIKARLYGSAGYPVYWVLTPESIFEHREPIPSGYRTRIEYRHGDRISLPYADEDLDVSELLAND